MTLLCSKFEQYGTSTCIRDEKNVALCAGYTNDYKDKLAYISVVASLPEYSNKGFGKIVVRDFIEKAKKAGMKAVHLHTDKNNKAALNMYEKLGFREYIISNEERPEDKHLIYYIS